MAWHSTACCSDILNNMSNKRNTVQRQLIFDAVGALNIHATAEQVYEYLAKKHPSIGRATVYRNLNQMAQSGELLKISNFEGSTHYDHNCHDHQHLICGDCKQVFDVEKNFSDVFDRVQDIEGFDITDYCISFTGLCRECKGC